MPDVEPPPSEPSDTSATLVDLVAMCLDRMEHEGSAALEALCREHPAHAPRLRTRIAQLGAFGLVGAETESVPERLGQFRLLARLGGGGMGVVYAAEQEGLQRRVALKLLRPGTTYFPGARERFRREVEVLARLQHPGIVPVFAGGEEHGVPYLAMELVRGATLEEALAGLPAPEPARLHGRDLLAAVNAVVARRDADAGARAGGATASTGTGSRIGRGPPALFAGSWVITCVRIVRDVALALQHAHDQGVLHRDVKPSNVMLTPEGRVLLLDFGLAASEGSTRLTGSGQPLGSPAYMSPEQVRGERGAVDARADVYALGVTLYEALSLHQPFASEGFEQTARLVLTASPPALRELNPAVPRDLETVVLAAMEREAARRYAGPADLARDLDNILELRPISVRPPTAARRLRRWTQRRPALATACVLGALLLVAGPLGWELNRRRSMDAISAARDQAERNFQAALAAIGHVLRDVATEELEDVPRMQRARLVAIDRALELFPELERDRPDDELVLSERAELHLSRGDILRDLGRSAEAVPEFDGVVQVRRRLKALHDDFPHATLLAAALDRAAKARFATGRAGEALPIYAEGIALQRAACAAQPDRLDWRRDFTVELANQSESQRGLGQFDDARASLDEALALATAVREAQPADADALWNVARVQEDFSTLHSELRESAEALTWAQRALESYTAAHAADPARRYYAYDVATGHFSVAQCLIDLERFDEGDAEAKAGLEIMDGLLRDYPDVLIYQEQRSHLLDMLGISAGRRGRPAEARDIFKARVAALDEMCRLAPERTDLATESAQAMNNYATALLEGHENVDEALAVVERARARLAPVLAGDAPPAAGATIDTYLRYNRGLALCYADRLAEARAQVQAFEAEAGSKAFPLRYGADLWNELILSQRRVREAAAAAGTPVPAEALADAEGSARARMYAMLGGALDAGYADLRELSQTPSLDSFREEPEFKALLARLSTAP